MWMMDDGIYLIMGLAVLAIPVLGAIAFFIVLGQRRRLAELTLRLNHVAARLERLGSEVEGLARDYREATGEAASAPVVQPRETVAAEPAKPAPAIAVAKPLEEPEEQPGGFIPPPPAPPPPPRPVGLEERITSRWFVWVGAVALALAGLFLVKYAIDFGVLSPRIRIALGFVSGLALMAAGEWLRRRPLSRTIASVHPDHVPGALVSAGLFSAYAAIYAGYARYDLLIPLVAFLGLAAVSLLGFLLGALHAPIVAVVGLIGGLATPFLVESDHPSAIALFGYLAVIVAAATAVAAYRGWTWLMAAAAAGGLGWMAMWVLTGGAARDLVELCVFAGIVVTAALWFALKRVGGDGPGLWQGVALSPPELVAWATAVVAGLLVAWTLSKARDPGAAALILGLQVIAGYALAQRYPRFDGLTAVAGIAPFAAVAGWPVWHMVNAAREALAGSGESLPFTGLVAPSLQPWLALVAGLALLAVVAGYFAGRNARRPQVFAAASVLTAAAILAAGYVPVREVTPDRLWALLAAGFAVLAVTATTTWSKRRASHGERLTLGIYAVATVAAIAAVLAFTLRDAWLTVALALIVPALALIGGRLDLPEFRFVALIVATVLVVRLAFNPAILDYAPSAFLGRHWVLYGYGLPAAALYGASRLYARQGADRLVQVLDGAALAFALVLVSLEIRIFVNGSIDAADLSLFEASLHSALWLTSAWWRGRAALVGHRLVDRGAAVVLAGLGVYCVVAMQVFALDPLITDDGVGRWPILNTLLIAYLLPALLVIAMVWQFARVIPLWTQRAGAGLALVLTLLWLTLEVRRAFHGDQLGFWHATSDAEAWTVSAVWIATAFALFGLGIWTRIAFVRYGGLAILVMSVLKVFLLDMAGIEGLYRVASFLGLGLSLVAIGLMYQHFMHRKDADAAPS